uniref:Rab-GAP TBC domain-containing protein n=1 Tax=Caenorhabditis tropicalis TaxID=1561998 RepID=A0A1I7TJK6_9PELO
MSAFSEFFKKAHDALNGIRGVNSFFLGRDGDVVFSKNNVCVHETDAKAGEDEAHCPGYLTVHCQCDESMGLTLILQWLPNLTLHKNPQSIRSVSPRGKQNRDENVQTPPQKKADDIKVSVGSDEESSVSLDIQVEECGAAVPVKQVKRPTTLVPYSQQEDHSFNDALGVPSINVIPHTPIKHDKDGLHSGENKNDPDRQSQSSLSTSCADEMSEKELSSSEDEDDSCDKIESVVGLEKILESTQLFDKTPEQFALEHDLMLTDTKSNESEEQSRGRKKVPGTTSLFSVNLGKMRSMRVFYSNSECTSGQLVIATLDSHYKILHFHHGGLDKLAYIFEQWSSIKARSVQEGSPSAIADKQLIICQPAVKKVEKDPEEGLFEKIGLNAWRSYENKSGVIVDSGTHIFFASMDVEMREKVWPFLLRVYPWESSADQRENIKNDLFLEYQNIRKKRYRVIENAQPRWISIENSIVKDVVRTDRKNPFFAGDNNPNSEIMKNILLNYAVMNPEINYIQGMSDLLAPLLSTLKDEVDAYFCFKNFMQQTVFSSNPQGNENLMETNLTYLRNMLKLFEPEFYEHLEKQRPDAMQMMFVHRWILLCFKREFPENHALHIWECCWAHYRTNYFHLFVCVAIVSIYGKDVIIQDLPHDEILLFFSSLANHMDALLVLQKARGLLYEFTRMEKIPCVLEGLCSAEMEQWNSHKSFRNFYCNQSHSDKEACPYQ